MNSISYTLKTTLYVVAATTSTVALTALAIGIIKMTSPHLLPSFTSLSLGVWGAGATLVSIALWSYLAYRRYRTTSTEQVDLSPKPKPDKACESWDRVEKNGRQPHLGPSSPENVQQPDMKRKDADAGKSVSLERILLLLEAQTSEAKNLDEWEEALEIKNIVSLALIFSNFLLSPSKSYLKEQVKNVLSAFRNFVQAGRKPTTSLPMTSILWEGKISKQEALYGSGKTQGSWSIKELSTLLAVEEETLLGRLESSNIERDGEDRYSTESLSPILSKNFLLNRTQQTSPRWYL